MSAWKESYIKTDIVRRVRDDYFAGNIKDMAEALGYHHSTLSTYLREGCDVPPHAVKSCELYVKTQRQDNVSDLRAYLVIVTKNEAQKLEFAIDMIKGTCQELVLK